MDCSGLGFSGKFFLFVVREMVNGQCLKDKTSKKVPRHTAEMVLGEEGRE